MPSDSYLRINANGDGEGSWSNNKDQEEIARVRTKSSNSAEKFAIWTENIKNAFQDIVIIDIGGKLQEDKVPLFEAADSFVVLSSVPGLIAPWREFGESHGCRCLATIESDLDGGHDEVIFTENNYMHARLSGLERGRFLFDSVVIKKLADIIVCLSDYQNSYYLDFSKVGEILGFAMEWTASNGIRVTHNHFEPESGPLIHSYLSSLKLSKCRCKIFGLKANWVAAIASFAFFKNNQVSFFDERSGEFKPVTTINKVPYSQISDRWHIEEDNNFVFLSQNCKGPLSELRHGEFTIPIINEDKPLYLAGRFPLWTVSSILISYSSPNKYLFQPGNHYICVDSVNPAELGTIKER